MIALDASAVIYLMKMKQSDIDGVRGRKVERYLQETMSEMTPIGLPAVALSEVHAKKDVDSGELIRLLEPLDVLVFDAKAALVAGEIASTTNWKSAIPPFPGGRQVVKLDTLIAATAIAADATVLLTNDNRYEKLLANHPIQVVLIDSLPNP